MSGIEKMGLALMITTVPSLQHLEGWEGVVIGIVFLIGSAMFVIPQRKP